MECLTFNAMLGNAVASPFAHRFGRTPVLIFALVLFAASAVRSVAATDSNVFIFARMLGGVAVGLALLIALACFQCRDLPAQATRSFHLLLSA